MLVERKEYRVDDGEIGYIESIFKSENILKTTYFPEREMLYIAFSRGHIYSYGNISLKFYEEFEKAESHGKFFYKYINKKKEYPYRREFTLYPNEVKDLKDIVENHKTEEDDES